MECGSRVHRSFAKGDGATALAHTARSLGKETLSHGKAPGSAGSQSGSAEDFMPRRTPH